MKNTINITLWMLVMLVLTANFIQAQQCSTRTTAGRYLVRCDGYLTPGPNAPQVPGQYPPHRHRRQERKLRRIGHRQSRWRDRHPDRQRNRADQSRLHRTIIYSQTINTQPGPPINIAFVVSENGDKIDGLVTDSGSTFACKLTRISKGER